MKKKILALALTLTMVLSMLPTAALATDKDTSTITKSATMLRNTDGTSPTFEISTGTDLYKKASSDLFQPSSGGDAVTTSEQTITVKGTAKNITEAWTDFSSNEAEQKGHYLPLTIKLPEGKTANNIKEVVVKGNLTRTFNGVDFFNESSAEGKTNDQATLVMRLDDLSAAGDPAKKTFTIDITTTDQDATATTYTIDVTNVVLEGEAQAVSTTAITFTEPTVAVDTTLSTTNQDFTITATPADSATAKIKWAEKADESGQAEGDLTAAAGKTYTATITVTSATDTTTNTYTLADDLAVPTGWTKGALAADKKSITLTKEFTVGSENPPEEEVTVTVTPATATIDLSTETKTATLTAAVKKADGTAVTDATITWTSDKTDIATVDDKGVVTGKTAGEAVITATATVDGKEVKGTATITVTDGSENPPTEEATVTVTPATATIDLSTDTKTATLTAAVKDAEGTAVTDATITWTSDKTDIATVDEKGVVTGKTAGEAVITATATVDGKEVKGTATITVTDGSENPPTETKYDVTITPAQNGTVTTSATDGKAAAGDEVTITATPDQGYEVEAINVADATGKPVTVTEGKFTMPAKNVTVTVTFKAQIQEITEITFTDPATPAVGDTLSSGKFAVTTTPADGADATIAWAEKAAKSTQAGDITVEAGKTYTATVTVTPKANFTLATKVTTPEGWTEGTATTEGTLVLTKDFEVAAKVDAPATVTEDKAAATVETPATVEADKPIVIDATEEKQSDGTTAPIDPETVKTAEVTIPAAAAEKLKEASDTTVRTPVGEVKLPKEAMAEISTAAGTDKNAKLIVDSTKNDNAKPESGKKVAATFKAEVKIGDATAALSLTTTAENPFKLFFKIAKGLSNVVASFVDASLEEQAFVPFAADDGITKTSYNADTGELILETTKLGEIAVQADDETQISNVNITSPTINVGDTLSEKTFTITPEGVKADVKWTKGDTEVTTADTAGDYTAEITLTPPENMKFASEAVFKVDEKTVTATPGAGSDGKMIVTTTVTVADKPSATTYEVTFDVGTTGLTVEAEAENPTITNNKATVKAGNTIAFKVNGTVADNKQVKVTVGDKELTATKGVYTTDAITAATTVKVELVDKTQATEYTVKFDLNGGTSAAIADQKVAKDDKATEPATDPTRTGYEFEGWFEDADHTDGETPFDFTNTAITGDKTLFAHWTAKDTEVKDETGNTIATVTPDEDANLDGIALDKITTTKSTATDPATITVPVTQTADGKEITDVPAYATLTVNSTEYKLKLKGTKSDDGKNFVFDGFDPEDSEYKALNDTDKAAAQTALNTAIDSGNLKLILDTPTTGNPDKEQVTVTFDVTKATGVKVMSTATPDVDITTTGAKVDKNATLSFKLDMSGVATADKNKTVKVTVGTDELTAANGVYTTKAITANTKVVIELVDKAPVTGDLALKSVSNHGNFVVKCQLENAEAGKTYLVQVNRKGTNVYFTVKAGDDGVFFFANKGDKVQAWEDGTFNEVGAPGGNGASLTETTVEAAPSAE